MLQPNLTSVEAIDGCVLLLTYETGERKLFDVAPYANGSWYGELADDAYFKRVSLLPGGVGIEWPNGQDVAPHELYERGIPVPREPETR